GNEAALATFDDLGADAVFARNRQLADRLRDALDGRGWHPIDLPHANRSTIVAVPLGDADGAQLTDQLRSRGVTSAARRGNLRLSVHVYNHEDDIARLVEALPPR